VEREPAAEVNEVSSDALPPLKDFAFRIHTGDPSHEDGEKPLPEIGDMFYVPENHGALVEKGEYRIDFVGKDGSLVVRPLDAGKSGAVLVIPSYEYRRSLDANGHPTGFVIQGPELASGHTIAGPRGEGSATVVMPDTYDPALHFSRDSSEFGSSDMSQLPFRSLESSILKALALEALYRESAVAGNPVATQLRMQLSENIGDVMRHHVAGIDSAQSFQEFLNRLEEWRNIPELSKTIEKELPLVLVEAVKYPPLKSRLSNAPEILRSPDLPAYLSYFARVAKVAESTSNSKSEIESAERALMHLQRLQARTGVEFSTTRALVLNLILKSIPDEHASAEKKILLSHTQEAFDLSAGLYRNTRSKALSEGIKSSLFLTAVSAMGLYAMWHSAPQMRAATIGLGVVTALSLPAMYWKVIWQAGRRNTNYFDYVELKGIRDKVAKKAAAAIPPMKATSSRGTTCTKPLESI
jgi:hypothetical protein